MKLKLLKREQLEKRKDIKRLGGKKPASNKEKTAKYSSFREQAMSKTRQKMQKLQFKSLPMTPCVAWNKSPKPSPIPNLNTLNYNMEIVFTFLTGLVFVRHFADANNALT